MDFIVEPPEIERIKIELRKIPDSKKIIHITSKKVFLLKFEHQIHYFTLQLVDTFYFAHKTCIT